MYQFILMKVNGVNGECTQFECFHIKCILHIHRNWTSLRRKSNIPKAKWEMHHNSAKMNALNSDLDRPLFARPNFNVRNIYLVAQARNKQHLMWHILTAHICLKLQCIAKENQKTKNKRERKRFKSQNHFNSGESVSYSMGFSMILLFRQMIV